MTISELQKELQVMYEKYGDIYVVLEETDWTGTDKYYFGIFGVEEANVDDNTVVALTNN